MNRLLIPLAEVYGFGALLREQAYRRGWLKSRRLSRPVISVGNLTMGGSGKTPLVGWIAEMMLRRGYKPAILTRGYGRQQGPDLVVLEPQGYRKVDPRSVGDEPALLAHALPQVPIVICADRHRAGLVAEERFGVDLHILDDGFQHFALGRDVDVVAVDATQELSDFAVLPAGRQRERCGALRRADMILLTRTELQCPEPVERKVRSINSNARIFHCSTVLRGVTAAGRDELLPLEDYRDRTFCAFCGIGNPRAFFAGLRRWGFNLSAEIAFSDHHVYGPQDIERLRTAARDSGAQAFVTTEKDLMNLSPQYQLELPVLACRIQPEIANAKAVEEALLAGVAFLGTRQGVASSM